MILMVAQGKLYILYCINLVKHLGSSGKFLNRVKAAHQWILVLDLFTLINSDINLLLVITSSQSLYMCSFLFVFSGSCQQKPRWCYMTSFKSEWVNTFQQMKRSLIRYWVRADLSPTFSHHKKTNKQKTLKGVNLFLLKNQRCFHYTKNSGNLGRKSDGKVRFGSVQQEYSDHFGWTGRTELPFHFDKPVWALPCFSSVDFTYLGNSEK